MKPQGRKLEGAGSGFEVRPTVGAKRDAGDIFKTLREKYWVIRQLAVLRHWPLDTHKQQQLGSDLDFSKVEYQNETFFELRLDDAELHQKNLRVFFWVHDKSRTIWIVHAYWKKTNRLEDVVKRRVSKRIKDLKAGSII
jgi:phage-related protein